MAALPGDDWSAEGPFLGAAARVRHVFTHFALELAIVELPAPVGEGWWQPLDTLDQAGLPTLYRHAASAMFESRPARPARAA